MDLLGEYNISAIFNVWSSPFDVGDDSRTNPFKERGNDENQQALKNPLHGPIRPIIREDPRRSKKHLMGWFKRFWTDSKTGHSKLPLKEDESIINLIEVDRANLA